MKNRLMFLLLALFCASSTMYATKKTGSADENTIHLECDDDSKNKKNLYGNPYLEGTQEYKQWEEQNKKSYENFNNLYTTKNDEKAKDITTNQIEYIKMQPTILTIATFSLIGNAFLGCATQALNISNDYSFILFFTANWGLQAWYQSRIQKEKPKNTQENTKKSFANNFGIKLKPYCSRMHWYSAIPTYILASAFTEKTMQYLLKK